MTERGKEERRLSPRRPSRALLQRCPAFRSLWDRLEETIPEPDVGLATEMIRKCEKEKAELKAVRLRYLVKLFLLEELKEFNTDARNELEDESSPENTLHDSLHHSLAIAGAMQSLKVDKEREEGENLQHGEQAMTLVGQSDFVLGLTAKDLTHRSMNIADSIATNQKLIPQFELHISQMVQRLCLLFQVDPNEMQDPENAILSAIDEKISGASEMPDCREIDRAVTAICEAHQEIQSVWGMIASLLESHVLGEQVQSDKERLAYQETMIRLHTAHTECLLHNIMHACYAPEALKGLAALREILDQERTSTMHERQELMDRLEQCKRLGPEYLKLAQEYTTAKESLKHAQATLKDMEDMERDLDDMRP